MMGKLDRVRLSGLSAPVFHPTCQATLLEGDVVAALSHLGDESVQTTVTSPPYWSLRDYGIEGQIGLENNLDDYTASLVNVFEQVRRVTAPDGTLWLNLGDSFTSGGRTWRAPDKKNPARQMSTRPPTPEGLKPKDLIGVPWRVAFALQAAGWFLRTDIVWDKPNAMPESVSDRPTISHEYMFLFSKSKHYQYDKNAVLGPNGRNLRSVWSVNTQPYKGAHFAVFPEQLVQPAVLLSTTPGQTVFDPFTGSGTTGVVAVKNGRKFLGVELNPEYASLAQTRIDEALASAQQTTFDF